MSSTVVGINFGNSYASIAVITKEGTAECIANEDGERQIAAAIAFHGEEMYIGNQAPPQLVKNAENTIMGFRNLLGKKFSEIPPAERAACRVVAHPTLADTPCYAVRVLVPSPAPLSARATPTPTASSRASTQHPTPLATPRSEPVPQTRHVTPHDAAVLFLRSLYASAADFLGRAPAGAVLSVPAWFAPRARAALRAAAAEAGVAVRALLEEHAAAAAAAVAGDARDRTALLVDWGATDLAATLLSARGGLVHVLAQTRAAALGTAGVGGADEALARHLAKEFAKRSGAALQVCPAAPDAARAQAKLLLALPHVKRSLTTGGATQVSIESLHAGLDLSASVSRTRALVLLGPVFARVAAAVGAACAVDGAWIDEVVWVGGGGGLGALGGTAALRNAGLLGADTVDATGATGVPEEAVARGCALHGAAGAGAGEGDGETADVCVMRRTVGVVVPEAGSAAATTNGDARPAAATAEADELGGQWIPVVRAETPLPARRTVRFSLAAGAGAGRAAFEVWEVSEVVRVRRAAGAGDGDVDAESGDEAEEERERGVRKERYLGVLVLPFGPAGGAKRVRRVEVRCDAAADGALGVGVREDGGEWVRASVGVEGV